MVAEPLETDVESLQEQFFRLIDLPLLMFDIAQRCITAR